MRWGRKTTTSLRVANAIISPSMLWGRGWRARVRRWFNRPHPIYFVIEPGTPRAEEVRVVGVNGTEIFVERG